MFKLDSVQMPQQLSQAAHDREKVFQWIVELCNTETRENALSELSSRRDIIHDLGPIIWHTTGTIAALLFEIVSTYQFVNPPTMSLQQVTRLCNALALLQCVGAHPDTRSQFLKAQIPLYMYPFLHNANKCRNFEHLRLTSLGVIGALVKTEEQEVITFLLTTEIIPLCLRIMETGFELTKTLSTFILQKILMDDNGLSYICQTYDRFSHVALILGKMVLALEREPSTRLLRHVVGCYVRLSENSRAREALRQCLPEQLKDMSTFSDCLARDQTIAAWLLLLKNNLESVMPIDVSPGVPSLVKP
ncbi:CCR4-NOT transcription complex subunit 9 [Myzus persicae]|uniref:CCR4-NOT transcription complex subunit 9 n=1 Tax=Myzus persicae TaxID=13164 RepID=UPI000B937AAC|nr:CCR4-NOT transcription complex subunit 9 [Myzus persicae]